jgi:uroporphyrinogen-III decarboxylase
MEKIAIKLPYRELLARKERWDKAIRFEQPDRVPVLHYIGSRYWLPLIGYADRIDEYTSNARTMLKCQLLGQKWILENVKSDFHKIVCYPDFMWVEDVDAFGAKTVFPKNDSPWVARPHFLQSDENLDRLRGVDWVHGGLHGKMLSYFKEMKEFAGDYEIVFADGKVIPAADTVYPGGAGIIGIAGLAGDLCSVEKFSLDMFDKPDWVKELLEIIVDKAITWIDAVAQLNGGKAAFCSDFNEKVIHVGDDGTAQMSPAQMEEFMRTPHVRLAEHIRSKGGLVQAHNCGRADHLLKFWKDTVRIDRYIGFSYLTDKKALKETMGGKVFLMGGIDTVKLHDGKPQDVLEDCRANLAIFKDCNGFVMMDGHNVAPGTTVENLNAMTEAAERFGAF